MPVPVPVPPPPPPGPDDDPAPQPPADDAPTPPLVPYLPTSWWGCGSWACFQRGALWLWKFVRLDRIAGRPVPYAAFVQLFAYFSVWQFVFAATGQWLVRFRRSEGQMEWQTRWWAQPTYWEMAKVIFWLPLHLNRNWFQLVCRVVAWNWNVCIGFPVWHPAPSCCVFHGDHCGYRFAGCCFVVGAACTALLSRRIATVDIRRCAKKLAAVQFTFRALVLVALAVVACIGGACWYRRSFAPIGTAIAP